VATRVKKDTVGISDEVKRGFLNSKDFSVLRASTASIPSRSTVGNLVETSIIEVSKELKNACSCSEAGVTCLNKKLYFTPANSAAPHYGRTYWVGAYGLNLNAPLIAPGESMTFCVPVTKPDFYDATKEPYRLSFGLNSVISGSGNYRMTVYPPSTAPIGYSWEKSTDSSGWKKVSTVEYYGPSSPKYGNSTGANEVGTLPFGNYKVVVEREINAADIWPPLNTKKKFWTLYWSISPQHSSNIYLYGPPEAIDSTTGSPVSINLSSYNELPSQSTYKRTTNVVINSLKQLVMVDNAPVKKTLDDLKPENDAYHEENKKKFDLITLGIATDTAASAVASKITWPPLEEIDGFPRYVKSNKSLSNRDRKALGFSFGTEKEAVVNTAEVTRMLNSQIHPYGSGQSDYPTPPGKSGQAFGYSSPLPFSGLYIPPGDAPDTLKASNGKDIVSSDWLKTDNRNRSIYAAPAGNRYIAVCPIVSPYVTGGIQKVEFGVNGINGTDYDFTGGASMTVVPPSNGLETLMEVIDTGGVSSAERNVKYDTMVTLDGGIEQTPNKAVVGYYLIVINTFFVVGPQWRLDGTLYKDETKKILWTWEDVLASTTESWDDPTIHSGNYWNVYWRCWFDQ
jgi:hypothetical protein